MTTAACAENITPTPLFSKRASAWFRGLAILMVIVSHYAEWWAWFTPSQGNMELLRQAFTKLGEYGVAIFFLFSGYGLSKSIGSNRMNRNFIGKRIMSAYLPYLLVVGVIELLSDGFDSVDDVWDYLSGHDYWFMAVLFSFYLAFIVIWAVTVNTHLRTFLFVLFTAVYSFLLFRNGKQGFWYVSNPAFPIGVMLAAYEGSLKKLIHHARIFLLPLCTVAMFTIAHAGLFPQILASLTDAQKILSQIIAIFLWTVLIILTASGWKTYDPVLRRLGKDSLYLYLTHTFLFMRCVNHFTCAFWARFLISAVLTITVSLLSSLLINALSAQILKKAAKCAEIS